MAELSIKGTKKTPSISFSDGHLSISGCSVPEDPKKFYKIILSLFEDENTYQADNYLVEVKFEYCDTGSIKWVLNILMEFQKHVQNKNAEMRWYYEYDDFEMLELGEFVKLRVNKVTFNLVELQN
jgi:hypothetical protein